MYGSVLENSAVETSTIFETCAIKSRAVWLEIGNSWQLDIICTEILEAETWFNDISSRQTGKTT